MQRGISKYQQYIRLLRLTLERREDIRAYLELLLTLAAVSFFAWFAIRPTIATIATLVRQVTAQKEIVEKLDRKLGALSLAQQQRQGFEKNFILADQAVPLGAKPELLSRQLEALAAKNNITLALVSIDQGETEQEIPMSPLSAVLVGNPQNALSFLTDLQDLRRPFLWKSLSISGKPPGAAVEVNVSFTGVLPYYPERTSSAYEEK